MIISHPSLTPLALVLGFSLLAGCQTTPKVTPAAAAARSELRTLQADTRLSSLAPSAIRDADAAVRLAETQRGEPRFRDHLAYLAANKVKTARALATARYAESQLQTLSSQRDQIRLDARTVEADQARQQAEAARQQVLTAEQQRQQATDRAQTLEQQLSDLKSRQTERGTVYTLSDALFATGKADLKPGAQANFDRLAGALNRQPDQHIVIEGHTDSVGSSSRNQALSQQRADAVKEYLVGKGVDGSRITAVGKGEAYPLAPNGTAAGRQRNRRVEVILENAATAKPAGGPDRSGPSPY